MKMKKCDCYQTAAWRVSKYNSTGHFLGTLLETHDVCTGTRECDECSCGGDRTKCSFYPEIRKKALSEAKQSDIIAEYQALVNENLSLKADLEITRRFICDNGLEFVLSNYIKHNRGGN